LFVFGGATLWHTKIVLPVFTERQRLFGLLLAGAMGTLLWHGFPLVNTVIAVWQCLTDSHYRQLFNVLPRIGVLSGYLGLGFVFVRCFGSKTQNKSDKMQAL
jgi:hypothetical protein